MRLKIFIITIFFALAFCFLSCNVNNVNVDNPTNLEINELNLQKIKLKILLPIDNPNNFSFKVSGADIDFFINGLSLGKINNIEKFKVEANSKNEYPIHLEILPKDVIGNAISLYNDIQKSNPNIEVKGYLKVSKFGIPMKLKINHKQDIKL